MSWFGGGLSNLQGKITSFTAQVLSDVAETVQGDDTPESEFEEQSNSTSDFIKIQKQNEELIAQNRELGIQVSTLSRQYRNLLSKSQNHEEGSGGSGSSSNGANHQTTQVDESWQRDVQNWLKTQGIVLPPHLGVERIGTNQLNGASVLDGQDDFNNRQVLEQRIATLEEQLEDLDRQHQAELEIAITSRDQIKEENRQLHLQLIQLENDRREEQQIKSGHPLFPIDEESEETESDHCPAAIHIPSECDFQRLEKEQQDYRHHISHFTEQFQALGDRLVAYEGLQSQNEEIRFKFTQLQLESEASQRENSELQAKVESLRVQNELLASMTSVLDRITEENRLLESNLESAQQELRSKVEEIELLRRIEPVNSPVSYAEETEFLRTQLKQQIQQLSNDNEDLKRLVAAKEKDLRDSQKREADLLQDHQDLLSAKTLELNEMVEKNKTVFQDRLKELENRLEEESKQLSQANELLQKQVAEAERVLAEKRKTESDVDTLNQLLSSKSVEINQMAVVNLGLQTRLDELENQMKEESRQHSDDNASLKQRIEARELELEEIQKARCNLIEQHEELFAELDRVVVENNQLKANLTSSDQTLQPNSERIGHLETERIALLDELNRLELALTTAQQSKVAEVTKVESSTQPEDDWLVNQSRLEESISRLQERERQLDEKNEDLERQIFEINKALREAQDRQQADEQESSYLQQQLNGNFGRIAELENSNSLKMQELEQLLSEKLDLQGLLTEAQSNCSDLRRQLDESSNGQKNASELESVNECLRLKCRSLEEEKLAANEQIQVLEKQVATLEGEAVSKREEMDRLSSVLTSITAERDQICLERDGLLKEKELLRETLQAFQQQREQLVQTVQQKHQESVSYHSETLRLAKICEELKTRLSEQTELEQEVTKMRSENESMKTIQLQWQTEMDRLRSHLLDVEETYTQELLKSQAKEKTLRESLQSAEERANEQWRLGDQLVGWQDKHRQWLTERERLENEKGELEKSLDRLQHALNQLTRERERDIVLAQKELAQKLSKAESLQSEKDSEMTQLRRKLSEAQLGLEAAGRLTQQLDKTTAALAAAKEEVRLKETELEKIRHQVEQLQSGTDSKVDRSLVKNLLIGYFSAPSSKHRLEVLRIIATVMDFTADERHKSGVGDSSTPSGLGAWASGMLKTSTRSRTSSGNSSIGEAEKSLSEAFISFLESESARPSPPKLSSSQIMERHESPSSAKSSMTEFQPGRNEPTILRDVLRDTDS